jgi:hypothetical protein
MHPECAAAMSPYSGTATIPMDEALRRIGSHFEKYPHVRSGAPSVASSGRWSQQADAVKLALADARRRRFSFPFHDDHIDVELFGPDEVDSGQVGYSISLQGESLVGDEDGDWKVEWLVIGIDEGLGDPLFVDLSDQRFPVYQAIAGQGAWDPDALAPSLDSFLRAA